MKTAAINAQEKSKYSPKYVLFICVVFSVLILVRAWSNVALYAFAGVSLLVFLVSNLGHCIAFLFFLLPFATILKQNVNGMSVFALLFFLVVVKMVLSRRRVDAKLLAALIVFFVYTLLFTGVAKLTTIATMIAGILMLYCLKQDNVDVDMTSLVVVYSVAICLSSVLALYKESLPIINIFVEDAMLKLGEDEYALRFSGLQGNPNYYTLDIVVALSAIVALLYYKKEKNITLTICMIALSVFGLMSVSRSFLIAWIVLLICWFFLSVKQGAGKVLSSLLVVAIGVVVVYYFAFDYVNAFLFRFSEEQTGTLNDMTTGRIGIWQAYLETIFGDLKILFFGNGLNTVLKPGGKGTHNTYLESLFYLGIVGTAILVISIGISIKRVAFRGVAWLPVLVLAFRMFGIGILTNDNLWFYFSIALILACDYYKDCKKMRSAQGRRG